MTQSLIRLGDYDIVRGKADNGINHCFYVWRYIPGVKEPYLVHENEYFSDAARYIALQKGIDGDFRIGYVEALIQVYENGK